MTTVRRIDTRDVVRAVNKLFKTAKISGFKSAVFDLNLFIRSQYPNRKVVYGTVNVDKVVETVQSNVGTGFNVTFCPQRIEVSVTTKSRRRA